MSRVHGRLGVLSVLIALLGLAACSSQPTRFFTLDPVAPVRPVVADSGRPPMRVRRVTVPPALDRTELAYEPAPGEVKVRDFDHWAAPLGQTAVQVLAQDLAARLPAGRLIPPASPLPRDGVDVDVDILAFNVAGGQAVMQASWSESSRALPPPQKTADQATASGPRPRPSATRLVELTTPVEAMDALGEAQGLSRLLGQLSDRIAAAAAP